MKTFGKITKRSLEPKVDAGWTSGQITVTEIPIIRYDKADLIVCATLFDKLFDSYEMKVQESKGYAVVDTRTEIIMSLEGGQAFRDSDCSHFVDSWGYLATHDAWNQIDWDIVDPLPTLDEE